MIPITRICFAFFRRFQAALQARQLTVKGITTDGSALYPTAIQVIWDDLPHQIFEFHILELNQAVFRAVAEGRPKADQKKLVQKRQRLQQKISDLFEYHFLFVQHFLTDAERVTLQRITGGLPLLRILRQIMDEICRLFDRSSQTATALSKLVVLRK